MVSDSAVNLRGLRHAEQQMADVVRKRRDQDRRLGSSLAGKKGALPRAVALRHLLSEVLLPSRLVEQFLDDADDWLTSHAT